MDQVKNTTKYISVIGITMSEVPEDRLTAQLDFEDDMRESPEFYREYLVQHHEEYPEDVHWDHVVDKWVLYYLSLIHISEPTRPERISFAGLWL